MWVSPCEVREVSLIDRLWHEKVAIWASEAISPLPSYRELLGCNVSLYSSSGVPLPTLQWYKDAVPVSKLQNPRYKVLPSGGLHIQKLSPEDSGIFQCFASNEGGEIQTNTYLDVTSE